jgi:hypothetical protein
VSVRARPHEDATVSLITMASKKNRHTVATTRRITITAEPTTLLGMGDQRGKGSFPKKKAENVRERIRWLLKHVFNNNRADLGRHLKSEEREGGVTGQAITQVLNSTNSPGAPIILGLATYLGITESEVLAPFRPPIVEHGVRAIRRDHPEGQAPNMGDLVLLQAAIEGARYPKLENAIAFYGDDEPARWSRATVIAARDGYFEGENCKDWTPPRWAEHLDALEGTLRQAKSERLLKLPPTAPPPPMLPPAPAKEPDGPAPKTRRRARGKS